MKSEQYPELVAVKVSRELATEIRRRARLDDRPVSAYLRRLLAALLTEPSDAR